LLDNLAELIVGRGVMSAEELATHLQQLIEHGALDQPNPAKQKKELLDSRQENGRLLAELSKLRKQVRAFEAGHPPAAFAERQGAPASSTGALSARAQHHARAAAAASSAEHAALVAQSDSDRAAHAALRDEFLALSSQHTALQSSHHSLTLSVAEHKKLVESVTEENRSLRGYLTQWEASEERRILAEQQVMLLQEAAARAVGERENIFQEVRSFRVRVLALAEAKARGEEQAAHALASARRAEQAARDHAVALSKQLELLKADLRSSGEVVEWHRAQNVLHLTADAQKETRDKEKAQAEEVARLQAVTETWQNKYTLLLQKEGEELPHERVASYTLLQENAGQRLAVAALEARVGELVAQIESDSATVTTATETRKQAETEMAVLQRALQQMAIDLQGLQRALVEKSAQLQHAVEVKIPRMRLQRSNLAAACQRQNEAIQELAAQLQLQHHHAHSRSSRKSHRDAKHGAPPASSSSPAPADAAIATVPPSSVNTDHKAPREKPKSAHRSDSTAESAAASFSTTAALAAPADLAAESTVESLTGLDSDIAAAYDSAYAAPPSARATINREIYNASASNLTAEPDAPDDAPSAALGASSVAASAAGPTASAEASMAVASDDWYDPSGVWTRYTTEQGDAYYYYNSQTGESVWTDPLIPVPDNDAAAAAPANQASALHDPFDEAGGSAHPHEQASVAAAPAVAYFTGHASVQNSDLELTPLPSERGMFSDLPQLSARPTHASSAAAQPPEDEFGDPFAEENAAAAMPAAAPGAAAKGAPPVAAVAEEEVGEVDEDFF
jgi:hypothetical protein